MVGENHLLQNYRMLYIAPFTINVSLWEKINKVLHRSWVVIKCKKVQIKKQIQRLTKKNIVH